MNNKHDPRTRLIADTFHDDWTGGPTTAFARRAAAHARTRRAVRRALMTSSALTVIALVFFFSTHRSPLAYVVTVASLSSARPIAPKTPAYEIISDTEFEGLMGDRPLLILPQKNGEEKIVLLDR